MDNQHHKSCSYTLSFVICHLSFVICHLSFVKSHLSRVREQLPSYLMQVLY
ncbi:hypothetical protein [Coleofasciculus sp. F4-SAH-05]|uniref:hypothetical protein n=1 Tax=Coleofasciculus sp. F4-SAH-05 TaxID=3069525 RepID=UPI0032F5AE5D